MNFTQEIAEDPALQEKLKQILAIPGIKEKQILLPEELLPLERPVAQKLVSSGFIVLQLYKKDTDIELGAFLLYSPDHRKLHSHDI